MVLSGFLFVDANVEHCCFHRLKPTEFTLTSIILHSPRPPSLSSSQITSCLPPQLPVCVSWLSVQLHNFGLWSRKRVQHLGELDALQVNTIFLNLSGLLLWCAVWLTWSSMFLSSCLLDEVVLTSEQLVLYFLSPMFLFRHQFVSRSKMHKSSHDFDWENISS